jgi:hypothetical protein
VTSIACWSTTISSGSHQGYRLGGRVPAPALRDALVVTDLPPLVSPEREEVEPTAAEGMPGGRCRRITQPEQADVSAGSVGG